VIICHRELVEILPLQDLYSVYHMHKRLRVFVRKGRECVICGRFGTLLLVTIDFAGQRHVDLYTDDFVLMTVDHIYPKSLCKKEGWSGKDRESLDNKQPMCYPCNTGKGNRNVSNKQYKLERVRNGYPNKLVGVEVIRELVHNEGIFSKKLKKKHVALARTGRVFAIT
jgi:5-methylcytosine-specific restriction endonuclease McrA